MGLDRVGRVALVLAVALLVGCDSKAPPKRLMYGEPAAEFKPVRNSVVSIGRILRGTTLGRRFLTCKPTTSRVTRGSSSESASSARA